MPFIFFSPYPRRPAHAGNPRGGKIHCANTQPEPLRLLPRFILLEKEHPLMHLMEVGRGLVVVPSRAFRRTDSADGGVLRTAGFHHHTASISGADSEGSAANGHRNSNQHGTHAFLPETRNVSGDPHFRL
jgi:hypothetical protein